MTGMVDRIRAVFAHVDGWSDWKRSWLITFSVGCWVFIFLTIWSVYAATHLIDRYVPSEPGTMVTQDHQSYQVLDMRQTEVIVDGEEQTTSNADTVWVVVDLEVTIDKKLDVVLCDLPLVAVGKRTWKSETFYSREIPTWCDSEEFTVGKPYPVQLIYQVPTKYVDQVYGVVLEDPSSPAPSIVLRP